MTRKQELLAELKDLGVSDEHCEWLSKRNTAEGLQTVIDNTKALDIIAREARRNT